MQPLKSLTFVRIGDANSHKYTVNKKQLRAFKTIYNKINISWKEFGIEYDVVDWYNDVYEEHWSYKKGVEYYKGKVAPQHLIDYRDNQEALIDAWKDNNEELLEAFKRYRRYVGFSNNSYHSPPQTRGLYAFPQYRLETFLTHWDSNKLIVRHNKDGQQLKVRAKKYITINYNKPTLWCHFIEEAKELNVVIKTNKCWVLINSCDYLKVLSLWEKKRLREQRIQMEGTKHRLIYNPYQFISKDDLEVFLIGV